MRRPRGQFPERIESIADLPSPIAEVIRQAEPGDALREIIRIPPGAYPFRRTVWGFDLPFGWRQTAERFWAVGERAATVIDVETGAVRSSVTVPLAALVEVCVFQELLYSWIELLWAGQDAVNSIRVEYNSVGNELIYRGLTRMRETFPRRSLPVSGSPSGIDLADFPFKFQSFLRTSLMAGETLLTAVYQPAIRPAARRWQPFISPNRTFAVTDLNVLVIADQRNRFLRRDRAATDYSIVRHFYPLERLQQAAVEPGPDADRLRLRFGTGAAIHDATFAVAAPLAQQLCHALCGDDPEPGRAEIREDPRIRVDNFLIRS